ncbi:hypothetical protein KGF54_000502 [Candida jiufengensis]|uniref:uncharacterized protein n=1 Tax=Candida jiufengensis TaxID=497108 RepID=UPI0022251396|nr:uncharacterized protein KGF54_000502 [Candida jiufengensis]KAI5956884.1 hypothetical protein KGF54_000502 [Candida jiufengensis]
MSSTPSSSPTKRSVLSPKPTNFTSPIKKPTTRSQFSPKKSISKPSTPSKKKSSTLGFTIWEDKQITTTQEVVGTPTSNKQNHNDQENILQPKKIHNIRSIQRQPLSNLNISEFKGYITKNNETTQLTELYNSPNFNNDFKSLHKFNNLPCFVTPTKKEKYLTSSSTSSNYCIQKHKRSLSVGHNDSKLDLIKKNGFTILSN